MQIRSVLLFSVAGVALPAVILTGLGGQTPSTAEWRDRLCTAVQLTICNGETRHGETGQPSGPARKEAWLDPPRAEPEAHREPWDDPNWSKTAASKLTDLLSEAPADEVRTGSLPDRGAPGLDRAASGSVEGQLVEERSAPKTASNEAKDPSRAESLPQSVEPRPAPKDVDQRRFAASNLDGMVASIPETTVHAGSIGHGLSPAELQSEPEMTPLPEPSPTAIEDTPPGAQDAKSPDAPSIGSSATQATPGSSPVQALVPLPPVRPVEATRSAQDAPRSPSRETLPKRSSRNAVAATSRKATVRPTAAAPDSRPSTRDTARRLAAVPTVRTAVRPRPPIHLPARLLPIDEQVSFAVQAILGFPQIVELPSSLLPVD